MGDTFLGIDIGTSSVKTVIIDASGALLAQASAPLSVSRLKPFWSEQDPEDWWTATQATIAELKREHADSLSTVAGIGLSGQMHGATLLDAARSVLRPAILWNDGRSHAECDALERAVPTSRAITGNIAMPGFTAPKLLWVREHEPDVFNQIDRVLLPKDYVRYRMTGEFVSDQSDSAGTLWLDVANRRWSDEMLEVCGLTTANMPTLCEGTDASAKLSADVASVWGVPQVPVAGGAGDNAAGAAGVGVIPAGTGFVSLGTSGVLFVSTPEYAPNPDGGVHTFCHCVPGRWHQMAVILSAASCLSWATAITGAPDEATLIGEAESGAVDIQTPLFLPYLSGERTPHNDPNAQGVFFGMTHETTRADLARSVLEGVAYAFADGLQSLRDAGTKIDRLYAIGGGARSEYWLQLIADALQFPIAIPEAAELGPAYGAARLGRIAATGESADSVCAAPPVRTILEPDATRAAFHTERLDRYRKLYDGIRALMGNSD